MISLVEPNEKYLQSYIEAYREYLDNNVSSIIFNDATRTDIFEKYINYKYERNLPTNRVGAHYFWLVDDERDYFIGKITIRHCLNEALEKYGGHIGYGIRYSEWNKGYGTQMLKMALDEAKNIGLTKVLITCDDDNIASARVMEKNGFAFSDRIENNIGGEKIVTRRYWKLL